MQTVKFRKYTVWPITEDEIKTIRHNVSKQIYISPDCRQLTLGAVNFILDSMVREIRAINRTKK